jgi:hypothetical protein
MGLLGLISGMSVMHIIILNVISKDNFLRFYSNFSMILNLIFLILTNLCLIFGVTIAMIYYEKSEERHRRLDAYRHELRMQFTTNCVVNALVLIALLALYALPILTIPLYYK